MVWLYNFPLAPSVNDSLMPIAGKLKFNKFGKPYRQGHLVKTKHHKQYQEVCLFWANRNRESIEKIKTYITMMKNHSEKQKQRFALKIECFHAFEESRLFTVNNKNEQLDADNRLKPTMDAITKILGIDDKIYFHASSEKVTTHSKESECAMIRISLMKPRTLQDIMDLMHKGQKGT